MQRDPLRDYLHRAIPVEYNIAPSPVGQKMNSFGEMLNPMNWVRQQVKANPQYQQLVDVIDQNGGDPKTAFYAECEKRGANPDQILNQVRNNPFFQRFMR